MASASDFYFLKIFQKKFDTFANMRYGVFMFEGCAKCGEVHGCNHSLAEYAPGYESRVELWTEQYDNSAMLKAQIETYAGLAFDEPPRRLISKLCGPFGRVL